MANIFNKLFSERTLAKLRREAESVTVLEPEVKRLSDAEMCTKSSELKERIGEGASLDEMLPHAFALAREAAKRTLSQRPYDVQIMGGIVLHRGGVAEMVTGEGKTLAAVAPVYLNALAGKGVHVVTVNDYLARRDAVWMGQIYHALGLTVGCLVSSSAFRYDPDYRIDEKEQERVDRERDTTGGFLVQEKYLRPTGRREAYEADITYGTNHEFGFDYLRDNLAQHASNQVQGDRRYFAIIDEVDSILIDEARTPLIISAPDAQSSELYKTFSRVVERLTKDEDYEVDEKRRSVSVTEAGVEKVEKLIGVQNLYAPENLRLVHHLDESLRAKELFLRDREYVVRDGQVFIVDEFTGRILHGRRYSGGLHQAIEAKEGVAVKEESRTYAKISVQNYFRLYEKLAGMTGTAQTSAEEFHKVYGLDVVTIPTNKPLIRVNLPDLIYKSDEGKWRAVVDDIKKRNEKGQPVLVGTTSIEKNELVSALLAKAGVHHEVLNAKNHAREGSIIAQAGRLGAVTVATNMAGRGVDIILGGNPADPEKAKKVCGLGGLHVVGTERHEARRIDNQLRGRAGRQGDPGSSQFFLALDDDLMRIFGGDRVQRMMETLRVPEDQPIESGMVAKVVAQAQAKVEGRNFDIRKHLLDYDDVLNKQRTAVYRRRQEILEGFGKEDKVGEAVARAAIGYLDAVLAAREASGVHDEEAFTQELKKAFEEARVATKEAPFPKGWTPEALNKLVKRRSDAVAKDPLTVARLLGILDLLWMTHLEDLEALAESVGLRAYAQRDPLVEYRQEAHRLYGALWTNFNMWVFSNIFKLASASMSRTAGGAKRVSAQPTARPMQSISARTVTGKIGRNDPCPCGAINPATGHIYKYKKCGLIGAPHHKG